MEKIKAARDAFIDRGVVDTKLAFEGGRGQSVAWLGFFYRPTLQRILD
jgi:hypothetical protein